MNQPSRIRLSDARDGRCDSLTASSLSVFAAYLRPLLVLAEQQGIGAGELLAKSGINLHQLESTEARISSLQAGRLVWRLHRLTGRKDLGMCYGMMLPSHAHGLLAQAAGSSSSVEQALTVIARFMPLYVGEVSAQLIDEGSKVRVELAETYPLGPIRQMLFEALIVTSCQQLKGLVGHTLPDMRVTVDWPEPPYFSTYRHRLPPWEFNGRGVSISYSRSGLTMRPMMADASHFRRTLDLLESERSHHLTTTPTRLLLRINAILQASRPDCPAWRGSC